MGRRSTVARGRGTPRLALVSIALAAALSLPAVAGGSAPDPRGGVGTAASITRIKMVDDPANRFRPPSVTIAVGDKVKWVNQGNDRHSSTSSTQIWASGLLDPGESYTRRFRTRGSFRFFCTIHPEMQGTITVT